MSQQEHDTLLRLIHDATRKADEATIHSAQTADDAKAAHKRLGDRLLDLGERIQGVEECQSMLREKQARLEEQMKAFDTRPVDLSKAGFIPTRLWLGMIGATLSIVITVLMTGSSVKSDVRDQATQQAAHVKLEDERVNNQKQSDDRKDKEIAMIRVQLESLTKMVISQQRR